MCKLLLSGLSVKPRRSRPRQTWLTLSAELLRGASERLQRQVTGINQLERDYYQVGPVEQYLMASGRVYFRGLSYEDLHRLQFDLQTTSLEPRNGRIFLISMRDSRGLAKILEAPRPEELRKPLAGTLRELWHALLLHIPSLELLCDMTAHGLIVTDL